MRNDEKLNMDALLRDCARQQNAALKLDDIKHEILKKAEAGELAQEPADELSARRARMTRMRRMTIGFASAAAALLLLLSARNMLARSNMKSEAAPQDKYSMDMQDSTGSAAPEQAGILAMPAPAALPAETGAPAGTEAPAAQAPQLDAMQGPAQGGAAAQDNGSRSVAKDDPSAKAIEAVRTALTKAGREADTLGAYAEAELVENASFSLKTIASGVPAQIDSISLYVVHLGADAQNAKSYAVDAEAFIVYGEIVQ